MNAGDLSKAPWKLIPAFLKLLYVIHRIKPDIIHSFLPLITFLGASSGAVMRVPLIVTSRRALGTHQERYPVLRLFDLMANRLSHYVTVNSRAVWKDMVQREKINPSKLVLIYNGLEASAFEEATKRKNELRKKLDIQHFTRIVLVVANLIHYKGHEDLLEAANIVANHNPNVLFWLVGEDRGIQHQLERKARDLGIYDKIRFMGQRHDIPELFAISNLLVHPSHEEGFSNVILESMAAGLPVVATNVGGNSESVINGKTGWLVPPRCPEALAAKILDLLNDSEKSKSWGEAGRNRVKNLFSITKMVENHITLYEKTT